MIDALSQTILSHLESMQGASDPLRPPGLPMARTTSSFRSLPYHAPRRPRFGIAGTERPPLTA